MKIVFNSRLNIDEYILKNLSPLLLYMQTNYIHMYTYVTHAHKKILMYWSCDDTYFILLVCTIFFLFLMCKLNLLCGIRFCFILDRKLEQHAFCCVLMIFICIFCCKRSNDRFFSYI